MIPVKPFVCAIDAGGDERMDALHEIWDSTEVLSPHTPSPRHAQARTVRHLKKQFPISAPPGRARGKT